LSVITTARFSTTLGQRHGLDVGGGLPYYVIGKDMDKNEVYVTRDLNDGELWKKDVQLSSIHWINGEPTDGDYQIRVSSPRATRRCTFNW